MSTSQKIGIGIGMLLTVAGITAGLLIRKTDYVAKAKKTYRQTFMRDNISREETIKMLKESKNIKNDDDYIKYHFNFLEGAVRNTDESMK